VFLVMMMGLSLLVWRWMGLTERVFDLAATMTLLLAGVVLLTFGDVLLVTRAAMDDVLLEDYVMVARAKGMPERQVRDRHAARAALLPVLSRFTVSIPYFMTGLVILEAVFGGVGASSGFVSITQQFFGRPGMGVVIFDAVRTQDTPMIVGSMLVVGVLTLLLRVALDFAHAALDPRIRLHRGGDDD
jgi:peptide/nickel transport system permease protein